MKWISSQTCWMRGEGEAWHEDEDKHTGNIDFDLIIYTLHCIICSIQHRFIKILLDAKLILKKLDILSYYYLAGFVNVFTMICFVFPHFFLMAFGCFSFRSVSQPTQTTIDSSPCPYAQFPIYLIRLSVCTCCNKMIVPSTVPCNVTRLLCSFNLFIYFKMSHFVLGESIYQYHIQGHMNLSKFMFNHLCMTKFAKKRGLRIRGEN